MLTMKLRFCISNLGTYLQTFQAVYRYVIYSNVSECIFLNYVGLSLLWSYLGSRTERVKVKTAMSLETYFLFSHFTCGCNKQTSVYSRFQK